LYYATIVYLVLSHRTCASMLSPISFINCAVLFCLQYYEMSYGLNVEMHKQVSIQHAALLGYCCSYSVCAGEGRLCLVYCKERYHLIGKFSQCHFE
jgi:hypothetical protein